VAQVIRRRRRGEAIRRLRHRVREVRVCTTPGVIGGLCRRDRDVDVARKVGRSLGPKLGRVAWQVSQPSWSMTTRGGDSSLPLLVPVAEEADRGPVLRRAAAQEVRQVRSVGVARAVTGQAGHRPSARPPCGPRSRQDFAIGWLIPGSSPTRGSAGRAPRDRSRAADAPAPVWQAKQRCAFGGD